MPERAVFDRDEGIGKDEHGRAYAAAGYVGGERCRHAGDRVAVYICGEHEHVAVAAPPVARQRDGAFGHDVVQKVAFGQPLHPFGVQSDFSAVLHRDAAAQTYVLAASVGGGVPAEKGVAFALQAPGCAGVGAEMLGERVAFIMARSAVVHAAVVVVHYGTLRDGVLALPVHFFGGDHHPYGRGHGAEGEAHVAAGQLFGGVVAVVAADEGIAVQHVERDGEVAARLHPRRRHRGREEQAVGNAYGYGAGGPDLRRTAAGEHDRRSGQAEQ